MYLIQLLWGETQCHGTPDSMWICKRLTQRLADGQIFMKMLCIHKKRDWNSGHLHKKASYSYIMHLFDICVCSNVNILEKYITQQDESWSHAQKSCTRYSSWIARNALNCQLTQKSCTRYSSWIASRGGKSKKILYSSKSTITLLKFYLSTSKSTSLKIYSSKSKK